MKRRDFLKAGALAAGSLAGLGSPVLEALAAQPDNPLRTLGRTGLKVTAVSFGAMVCSDAEVIRYALDKGVNLIDTADCYMGGQNEKIVGEAIKGRRDALVIATKVHIGTVEAMRKSVEKSLSSLKTDRIDILQIHGVSTQAEVKNETARELFTSLKKEGKIRFAGVTTHSGQMEVLKAVSEDGFYDTVLVAANFQSPPALFEQVAAAADRGVGIIGMKTQNGGYRGNPYNSSPHAAALRFMLEKRGVHTAVPGMSNVKMVDENLKALEGSDSGRQGMLLREYRETLAGKSCAFCGTCVERCAFGQGGMAAARGAMYVEGYKNPWLAKERLEGEVAALNRCASCESCSAGCPQGLALPERARIALGVFGKA